MNKLFILLGIILTTYNLYASSVELTLYFEKDSYSLAPSEIEKIKSMSFSNSKSIIVQGSSDQDGGEEYNTWLSQKRAETIRDFLFIEKKISVKRITALGLGENVEAISNELKRKSEIKYETINTISKEITYPSYSNRKIANDKSNSEQSEVNNKCHSEISDSYPSVELAMNQKVLELEQRVKNLESKHQNTNNDSVETLENQSSDNEMVSKDFQTSDKINSKDKQKGGYSFRLKVNSYFADQSASFNSGASINEILSDPRLSIELDVVKAFNKKIDLVQQIGVRWNQYTTGPVVFTKDKWTGLAFKLNTGAVFKQTESLAHRLDLGFEHMLSHTVDGVGIIDLELQPTIKLNYQLLFEAFKNSKFNLEIGPKLGYIQGLSDIDTGYSLGLSLRSSLGASRKYFVYGFYEENNFNQDIRQLNIETLEIGVGLNF